MWNEPLECFFSRRKAAAAAVQDTSVDICSDWMLCSFNAPLLTAVAVSYGFYTFMPLICPQCEEGSHVRADIRTAHQVQLFGTDSIIEYILWDISVLLTFISVWTHFENKSIKMTDS